MNDDIKELLELAAKACGYEVHEPFRDGEFRVAGKDGLSFSWHPGKDDGDGARMEAELELEFYWFCGGVCAESDRLRTEHGRYGQQSVMFTEHNGNRQAARRMASLRVAAEVGRRMKT